MNSTPLSPLAGQDRPGTRLTGLYIRVFIWYLFGMYVLYLLGIEALYKHPTPFYALPAPVFSSPATAGATALLISFLYAVWRLRFGPMARHGRFAWYFWVGVIAVATMAAFLIDSGREGFFRTIGSEWQDIRWHLVAIGSFACGLWLLQWGLERVNWFDREPTPRETRWILTGLVVFSIVFPTAVAMIRGGPPAIAHPYERVGFEYIHDIGAGGSIPGLFRQYERIHEYLSSHSRVHPPGPIVLFWVLSYGVGREPMGLAIATIVVGALALLPLHGWIADMFTKRIALTACAVYSVMPSVVLFSATSADITFMPFTITTLFLFWRALHRNSIGYALAGGVFYALMSLMSFSLLAVGAFFGFAGLLRLMDERYRGAVFKTAFFMLAAFLSVHLAIRWSTGFDVINVFHLSKASFDRDQMLLDRYTPRYPSWAWKFINPMAWFYFAGIPVSVLFIWRLARPERAVKALFLVFALTLVALDILYLARGEGERSAMYILPFVLVPAAHLLHRFGETARSHTPLLATVAFLAFQCWFTEALFYTYW